VANAKLLIFSKYPAAGRVMTRLCPPLTHLDAARVQRSCIRVVCERAYRSWPVRPELVVSPDDSVSAFREIVGPLIPIAAQGDGDLGARIARAASAALAAGEPTVLIVGTDSPTMPTHLLSAAVAALNSSDVVIGPTEDGGFFLVGLSKYAEGMFADIEWGSDQVSAQTTARASSCGLGVTILEPWYDLDRIADLERAVGEIRDGGPPEAVELSYVIGEVLQTTNTQTQRSKK